jgi:hypothetical protein
MYKKEEAHPMNKKVEWSKLFCGLIAGGFGLYGIWCGMEYYRLVELAALNGSGAYPEPVLAVTCVTMIMGSLLSYLLYQLGLKNSRNKYGVDSNGQPFKIKQETCDEPDEPAPTASAEEDGENYDDEPVG